MFRANLRAKLTTAVPPQNEMSPCRRTCFGPPCTSVILLKAKDEYDRSNGRNGIPELLTSMMRAGCRAREQGLHVTSCDRMVGESCTLRSIHRGTTNAFSKYSSKQFSLYPNTYVPTITRIHYLARNPYRSLTGTLLFSYLRWHTSQQKRMCGVVASGD